MDRAIDAGVKAVVRVDALRDTGLQVVVVVGGVAVVTNITVGRVFKARVVVIVRALCPTKERINRGLEVRITLPLPAPTTDPLLLTPAALTTTDPMPRDNVFVSLELTTGVPDGKFIVLVMTIEGLAIRTFEAEDTFVSKNDGGVAFGLPE